MLDGPLHISFSSIIDTAMLHAVGQVGQLKNEVGMQSFGRM